jgi:hypothetical protein
MSRDSAFVNAKNRKELVGDPLLTGFIWGAE